MNLRRELESRIHDALVAAGAPADSPALIVPSARAQFGDYQANGVMSAAKRMKINPRELAGKTQQFLKLDDLAQKVEIAGPGFLNIHLRDEWVATQVAGLQDDPRLGVAAASEPRKVVVDYSAPNLAKEMHVGHLRSTIIGDAIARVLGFLGHNVIRQNHVGDWGTQFGMLIAYMESSSSDASAPIGDLEDFYRQAKKRFDEDAAFADLARAYVVRLQGGDKDVLAKWKVFLEKSLAHCQAVYDRLGALLTEADIRGESAYNADLPVVVDDLGKQGLLKESQGALCVFLPEFVGKDGAPLPLIVRKSDEGFLYATTDLAAIRYRVKSLDARRILYVVDARQSLHFRQVFAVARKAGFAGDDVSLEHVAFGTMMGEDGKPFKTRTGGTVKLMDLLDEAQRKAYDLVTDKNPALGEELRRRIARAVGVGAVKYADLSQNRTSDYVFSWEKMLSLDGNTAPYMQYAYARIRSIFRKGLDQAGAESGGVKITLESPAERSLCLKILQLPETLEVAAGESLPNLLCAYLYELAGAFMSFYENCPVLQSPEPLRSSRLSLCRITAEILKTSLGLLGIEVVEQM